MKCSRIGAILAVALVAAFSSTVVRSQSAEKPRRVGTLMPGMASDWANVRTLQALVEGLREHGWEEGRNMVLEARFGAIGAGSGTRRTQGRCHHCRECTIDWSGPPQHHDDTHHYGGYDGPGEDGLRSISPSPW